MSESVIFIDEPIEDYPDPIEKNKSIFYNKHKSKEENERGNKQMLELSSVTDEDMETLAALSDTPNYDEWPDFHVPEKEQIKDLDIVLTNDLPTGANEYVKSRICLDNALSYLLDKIDKLYLAPDSSRSRFNRISEMSDLASQMITFLWITDISEDTIHEVKESVWFLNSELIAIQGYDLSVGQASIK